MSLVFCFRARYYLIVLFAICFSFVQNGNGQLVPDVGLSKNKTANLLIPALKGGCCGHSVNNGVVIPSTFSYQIYGVSATY